MKIKFAKKLDIGTFGCEMIKQKSRECSKDLKSIRMKQSGSSLSLFRECSIL